MNSLLLASVLLLRLFSIPPIQPADDSRLSRIRPIDQLSQQLVDDGTRRSPTFAGLVADLERHDVIVYISNDPGLSVRGSLTFIVHTGSVTYVRVRVHLSPDPDDAIAALAHELQHATEVAGASRPVTSERELQELYRVIGFGVGAGSFESTAARATEAHVRHELRDATSKSRS
jgi:hypothetical protein